MSFKSSLLEPITRPILHTHFWPLRGTAAQRWALQSRGTRLNLEVWAAATTASSAPSGSIPEEVAWMPNSAELSSQSASPSFFLFFTAIRLFPPNSTETSFTCYSSYPPSLVICCIPSLALSSPPYFFFQSHQVQSSCSQSNPSNSVNLIFWIWSHRWSPLLALNYFFSFSLSDFFFLMCSKSPREPALSLFSSTLF